MSEVVEFWDGVKTNNPLQHLQALLATPEASHGRGLEFCCKTIRRAMEMPEFTLEVIIESLAKIKVGEDTDQQIQDMIEKRLSNLDSDIVIK